MPVDNILKKHSPAVWMVGVVSGGSHCVDPVVVVVVKIMNKYILLKKVNNIITIKSIESVI